MDLRKLAGTLRTVDGHGHSPFFMSSQGVPMGLDEVLDLGHKAHVSSYLSSREIFALEENPARWREHREALDEFQRARGTNRY